MGKNSEISWTDHTWNPWQGCEKVSAGCKNCYMFRDKKRYGQDGSHIHCSADATFFKPLTWKEPAKVFTCSWSDFFIKEADPWRDKAWDIIRQTPHLTYQILTKRPENIEGRLPEDWLHFDNVWLGVTAEDNNLAFERVKSLFYIPCKTRFISVEPMLGPIDLENVITGINFFFQMEGRIDWVICGGESGAGFREMQTYWAEELKDACDLMRIPFFMKQMSGFNPKKIPIPEHVNVKEFPRIKEE